MSKYNKIGGGDIDLVSIAKYVKVDALIINNWNSVIQLANNDFFTEDVIGMEIPILINNVSYTMQLIGVNHDNLADGSGKANTTWQLKGLLNNYHNMNDTDTSNGGWKTTSMRTWLNDTIYNQLPNEVKNAIKSVKKEYVTTYNGTTIEITNDKLWLLSSAEIGSNYQYKPKANEGTVYSYWKTHNTSGDRVKRTPDLEPHHWWLRSSYSYTNGFYCTIYTNGTWSFEAASSSYGVSFAFCI